MGCYTQNWCGLMGKVSLVTDDDLARARLDPGFRHQLVAQNLEMLLNQIKRLRARRPEAAECREIREGVRLAVQLAELLQRIAAAHPDVSNARPNAA
jgi:hypothetical protein